MTHKLLERLRNGWDEYDVPMRATDAMSEAADRIEALTAQLESTLRDRKAILEERDRTFALMLRRAEKAEAERHSAVKTRDKLLIRFTPKPLRYAPKDPTRCIIGVERPPDEDKTFFYDLIWCPEKNQFVTTHLRALNGATHFLEPRNLIGIVWPKERAALARAIAGRFTE